MLSAIKRSVRYKLMAVMLAATLAALLVAAAALLTYEIRNYREFLVSDATTQADILARMSAPALRAGDPETADENLALLASRRGIVAAAIYTPDEELFASFVRESSEVTFPPLVSGQASRFTGDNLHLFHPIITDDEVIGTVYLRATYDLAGRLRDYLLILGAVVLLSLGVAAGISLRLQRGVTGPVLAVTDVARKVVEERDFTLRARRTTDDEIGVLVDSFNSMLAEVGRMTEALETTNRRLVEETEERRSAEEALRAADRRKDEFLATLAHELRNPLAPMVNALQMLDVSGLDESGRQAHGIIERQLDHMVRLVDDLLDVSRITLGKLTLHTSEVDLNAVVSSAVDTVRPVIDSRRHTLRVYLPQERIRLEGDAVRLSQVFSNLLNNAAKYTEPGGTIRLSASVEDGIAAVEIADSGAGMSAETLATIFDMFTQGSGSTGRKTEAGLGVGLALARRLVELHGGTIEAESPGPGRGSTFRVRLPVLEPRSGAPTEAAGPGPDAAAAPPPAASPGTAPASGARATPRTGTAADGAGIRPQTAPLGPAGGPPAAAEPSATAGPGRRILLVDDNIDFATSLAMLLESRHHVVRVAHDADSAVDAARELGPEIAFLDIGLPETSGYELAARLRYGPSPQVKLVALSGWGQEQDRERSRRAGFAAHLVKPVGLTAIERILDGLDGLDGT